LAITYIGVETRAGCLLWIVDQIVAVVVFVVTKFRSTRENGRIPIVAVALTFCKGVSIVIHVGDSATTDAGIGLRRIIHASVIAIDNAVGVRVRIAAIDFDGKRLE
jgi:hypothetical protein